MASLSTQLRYEVPGIHCDACRAAIEHAVGRLPEIRSVDVDLTTKQVVVTGGALDDARIRDAIDAAGFDLA